MIDMITDRTADDVKRVKVLHDKIQNGTITAAELDEWTAGLKGALNASDLNRVGGKVNEIVEIYNEYGAGLTITGKTNWDYGMTPTISQMREYLSNINTLKSLMIEAAEQTGQQALLPAVWPVLPETMSRTTYTDWNNIELTLEIIREILDQAQEA